MIRWVALKELLEVLLRTLWRALAATPHIFAQTDSEYRNWRSSLNPAVVLPESGRGDVGASTFVAPFELVVVSTLDESF